MKATAPNFSDPRLPEVWREWQKAPAGQALDKWLKHQLPRVQLRYEDQKTERSSLVLAMFEALRYQQLAQACEAAFNAESDMDWQAWDAQWQPAHLSGLAPEVLWGWVSLRMTGTLPNGKRYQQFEWQGRRDCFASLAESASAVPALQLLWLSLIHI